MSCLIHLIHLIVCKLRCEKVCAISLGFSITPETPDPSKDKAQLEFFFGSLMDNNVTPISTRDCNNNTPQQYI